MPRADLGLAGEHGIAAASDRDHGDDPRLAALLGLLDRRARPTACPHCGSGRLQGWGTSGSGRRRFACKGCGRTVSAMTGTSLLGVHDPGRLQALARAMLAGATCACRAMAAELGVGKNTVWRWRSGIMNALDGLPAPTLDHVVAADHEVVRDSRKASREWVRHAADPATWPAPDRPRWIDVDRGRLPEPLPRARFRIPLVAVIDALDGKRAMLRGDLKHGLASETWRHRGRATTGHTLHRGTGHDAAAAERAVRPGTGGQRSMAVDPGRDAGLERPGDALRSFLLPFRGPATRHLRGYLAWFSAIRSTAPAATPTRPGDMRHPHPSIAPP